MWALPGFVAAIATGRTSLCRLADAVAGPKPATPHTGAAHLWRELRATNYAERLQYAAFAGLVPDPFLPAVGPPVPQW